MPEYPRSGWEQRLRETVAQVEDEVQRAVAYLNDEVVPEVRRTGSEALRAAAAELSRLAQRMDDHATQTPPPPPPPPPPDDPLP
jgi:hypothetical protein